MRSGGQTKIQVTDEPHGVQIATGNDIFSTILVDGETETENILITGSWLVPEARVVDKMEISEPSGTTQTNPWMIIGWIFLAILILLLLGIIKPVLFFEIRPL